MSFVSRINAHDVEGIVSLMARDHVFVDSLGRRFGRPGIEDGWRRYFVSVPDYRVTVETKLERGSLVALFGKASGTYVPEGGVPRAANRWATPVAFRVKVQRGKVSEWRVYSDNEPIRARMRGSN